MRLQAGVVAAVMVLTGCASTATDVSDAVTDATPLSPAAKPAVHGSWTYQAAALAGTGNTGFTGDGAAATAAAIWQPRAMITDADATYLADTWNNRIRKIDSKGVITTIAGDGSACMPSAQATCGDGGPAQKAQLNRPSGLVLTKDQKLVVADTMSNRIRQIDLATGVITNLAGTGDIGFTGDAGPALQAQLAQPLDIAFDSIGNLLIADTDNNRIRKVNPQGIITTIAGIGGQCVSSSSCGTGGPATDAQLASPSGIEVDGQQRILIADTNSHTIRVVDSGGVFSTFAGTGVAGISDDGNAGQQTMLSHPRRVRVIAGNKLVISDTGNQRLMVAAGDGHQVWQATSQGIALSEPWDAAGTSAGIAVADAAQNRLLALQSPTGPTLQWGAVCGPQGCVCGPDTYPHPGQTGILSDVLMLLPGTTSLDVTGWGATGGWANGGGPGGPVAGGAGGYAKTLAPAISDQYAVIIGCQGAPGAGKSGSAGDQAIGAGGGGGASALVTLPGYLSGVATGNVALVAGGGGGGSGATCWAQSHSYPLPPRTPCYPGSAPDTGAAGGNRTGAAGRQATGITPWSASQTGATGGSGTGLGGKAASNFHDNVPVEPDSSGAAGFGGPGGDGSSARTGGWGPQWCRASVGNCPAGQLPPGSGGNGIKQNLNGGGGGGGAGGGGGGWANEASEAFGAGAGAGGGGGSWAICADTTKYPDPNTTPAPPGTNPHGYLIVTPGSAPAAQQCQPVPTVPSR